MIKVIFLNKIRVKHNFVCMFLVVIQVLVHSEAILDGRDLIRYIYANWFKRNGTTSSLSYKGRYFIIDPILNILLTANSKERLLRGHYACVR